MTTRIDGAPDTFIREFILENADYYSANGISGEEAEGEAIDAWFSMNGVQRQVWLEMRGEVA